MDSLYLIAGLPRLAAPFVSARVQRYPLLPEGQARPFVLNSHDHPAASALQVLGYGGRCHCVAEPNTAI